MTSLQDITNFAVVGAGKMPSSLVQLIAGTHALINNVTGPIVAPSLIS